MKLSDLIQGIEGLKLAQGNPATDIQAIESDSRSIGKDALFCALPGTKNDGTRFIGEALDKGAVAILASAANGAPWAPPAIALLVAEDVRRSLALLAARFYAGQPKTVAAITGTSGKTSTAIFLQQLWALEGHRSASLGTLGILSPAYSDPGQLTTPDPIRLHRALSRLASEGITHAAMEASSHGLDQRRLDGVKLQAAAFTNLSHDHIDYHGTIEAYREAKERLFLELLPAGAAAIINTELAGWETLAKKCKARQQNVIIVNAGRGQTGDLRLLTREATQDGQNLSFSAFGEKLDINFPIAGQFQASNLLTALALAIGCGSKIGNLLRSIEEMKGVPGRIERIAAGPKGGVIYVDYAHKPAALESVLRTLRPHTQKRLIVVFGCGGDRDRTKRPEMGRIAASLADRVIVTDDNPRTENPHAIREEVLKDAPGAIEIGDRTMAITQAIKELAMGDVLVIAGKGHETYQIIGDQYLPFDDRDVAKRIVAELSERAA